MAKGDPRQSMGNSARDRCCPRDWVLIPAGVWEVLLGDKAAGAMEDSMREGVKGLKPNDRTNIWYLLVRARGQ